VFGELVRLALRMGVEEASFRFVVDCVDELCDLGAFFGGGLDVSDAREGFCISVVVYTQLL
jgi:hypothetical protein